MIKKLFIFCLIIFLTSTSKQNAFAQTKALNNPESLHELTLEVDKNQAVANGQDAIAITATLKDRTSFEPLENTPPTYPPIANTQLTISLAGGGTNLNQTSQVTDANGQVKAYLTATTAGEKTITVTDTSLNSAIYTTDYYQVSLDVTFTPAGTPKPTLTPIQTPTPTPWQSTEPVNSDPVNSYFSIDPPVIGILNSKNSVAGQTAIIKITLRDKDKHRITNEIPRVIATGEGNVITQPTAEFSFLAYFSSTIAEEKKIIVKVGDVEIGKEQTIRVKTGNYAGLLGSSLDISSSNSPKNRFIIDAHRETPINFYIPEGRQVDKVIAVIDCGPDEQQLTIPLVKAFYNQDGGQLFQASLPAEQYTKGLTTCTLRITIEPSKEPEEPLIEILISLVDPYGTIYDAKTGEIIEGAVVTLYELQNNKWTIWNGTELEQVNPQTTDESGLYSFFVYPGKYYLTVEKEEYEPFTSELIEVIEEVVQLDVYLEPKSNTTLWLLALLIPAVFVIGTWFIWRKKKRIITPDTEASQPLTS